MRVLFLFLAIATTVANASELKSKSCESFLIDVQLTSAEAILDTVQKTIEGLFSDYSVFIKSEKTIPPSKLSVGKVLDLMYAQAAALYEFKHDSLETPRARQLRKLGLDPYSRDFYDLPIGPDYYDFFHGPIQKYFSTVMVAYAALHSELDPRAKLEIVDLGAGTGDTTESLRLMFPHSNITALDRSYPMLRRLQQRFPSVATVESDFGEVALPFEDNSKDFVVAVCSAGQYLNPAQFVYFLRHVKRILKPGGYFMMEFGENGHTLSGPKYADLPEFQSWVRDRGYEVEPQVSLHMKVGPHFYYPIIARKPR